MAHELRPCHPQGRLGELLAGFGLVQLWGVGLGGMKQGVQDSLCTTPKKNKDFLKKIQGP